jgi:hypothetical protein
MAEFKDKVKKYMGKEEKPKRTEAEYKKRENLIAVIESHVGALQSMPYDKISTRDLFALANGVRGDIKRK